MSDPITLCCSILRLKELLEADEFFQKLNRTTLFRGIPPWSLPLSLLDEICRESRLRPLPKGTTLKIEPIDSKESMLFEIINGYVKISDRRQKASEKTDGNSNLPPPALLAWRVPGELLGDFQFALPSEKAKGDGQVSDNEKSTDHIVATDDCTLLEIKTATVRKIAAHNAQLYLNIAANLVSKVQMARVRAQILRLPTVECMVAKLFLELLTERGFDPAVTDYKVINGTFFEDDLAAFLGRGIRTVQNGIGVLIDNEIIGHYDHDQSGRYYVCDAKKLNEHLEAERLAAIKRKKTKRRKK